DVESAGKGRRKPAKQGLDMDAMRAAIAAAMTRSKHEIPHYYLEHEIDLQAADDWLRARNADCAPGDRILMGTLFVKATALAAANVKGMNGQYVDGAFQPSKPVNAGVAVALRGGGLIAPAIMDAASQPLDQLMASMRDLVVRARSGRLRGSEMTDGTITISSLGENGVDGMTAVIYPPQVAIVAFGTPRPAPRVVDGAVTARMCVHVTLAADHRVSDGRRGAKFLKEIDTLLQNPEDL
uniref:2-oxo acid dehydrogenase subunit E2 n=1 Tax=Thalassovita aquimarina TaxID=2785917 RepID=UPI00356586B6